MSAKINPGGVIMNFRTDKPGQAAVKRRAHTLGFHDPAKMIRFLLESACVPPEVANVVGGMLAYLAKQYKLTPDTVLGLLLLNQLAGFTAHKSVHGVLPDFSGSMGAFTGDWAETYSEMLAAVIEVMLKRRAADEQNQTASKPKTKQGKTKRARTVKV